jgi:hypothetical protein
MSSKISIINEALLMIGEELMASAEEESRIGDNVRALYDNVRKTALEQYNWFFASKTAQLQLVDTLPLITDFNKVYQLPNDFLGLSRFFVSDPNGGKKYRLESGRILTTFDQVVIKYTFLNENEGTYTGLFCSYLSSLLAQKLAYDSTASGSYAINLNTLVEENFKKAKKHSAAQSPPEDFIQDYNERAGSRFDA